MSSDLLRRAAAKLRERAEAATPGPWRVESAENWDNTITYSVLGVTDDRGVTPVPFRTTTEDAGYHSQAEADVDFATLMHPPVALALAELLEHQADDMADDGIVELHPKQPDGSTITVIADTKRWIRWDWTAAVELSRAVLREEES